jgi:hypothetical protein
MLDLLDVRHISRLFTHEKETTHSRLGPRRIDVRGTPAERVAVADRGLAARDELTAFGLCEARAEGPASLKTLSQVADDEGLEAISLLRTDTRKQSRPESLADASPYDFLLYLGLMG